MDQYAVVSFLACVLILGQSAGRDLRPSDHGLTYQEDSFPPAQNGVDAQEMRSFFGAAAAAAATVQLPEAKNISDAVWSASTKGRAGDGAGRDHVRLGLLAASAVCGLTGVVLLVVSGVVFLIRLQRRRAKAERIAVPAAPTSAPTLEPVKSSGLV